MIDLAFFGLSTITRSGPVAIFRRLGTLFPADCEAPQPSCGDASSRVAGRFRDDALGSVPSSRGRSYDLDLLSHDAFLPILFSVERLWSILLDGMRGRRTTIEIVLTSNLGTMKHGPPRFRPRIPIL